MSPLKSESATRGKKIFYRSKRNDAERSRRLRARSFVTNEKERFRSIGVLEGFRGGITKTHLQISSQVCLCGQSLRNDVDGSELCTVLGIRLCVECDFLSLGQSLVAFGLDCGKVNENIIATVIVGNEAVSLLGIEPLNCSLVH